MMQTLQAPKRYRGFLLTARGWQKLQEQIQRLEGQTQVRQNARTIAERVQLSAPEGIHPMTVRKILQCQQGVDRRSIEQVFEALNLTLEEGDCAHANLLQTKSIPDFLTVVQTSAPDLESMDRESVDRESVDRESVDRESAEIDQFPKTVMFNHASQMVAILEVQGGYCIFVSK
jgi:hypothetical protein